MTDNITFQEIEEARKNKVFSMIGFELEEYRRNEQGNIVFTDFFSRDRYFFDARLMPGFRQFDTDQDASYFGVWVCAELLCTVTFAEGDICVVVCKDKDHYNAEIQNYIDFYDEGFVCIALDEKGKTVYRQDRSTFLIP